MMLGASAPSYTRLEAPSSNPPGVGRSRRAWLLAVAAVILLATLLKGIEDVPVPAVVQSSTAQIKEKLSDAWTLGRRPKPSQRITLIAMWDDDHMATYLPSFFQSVRYNSDSVDLLFINVRRKSDRCLNVEHLTRDATNIRVECIDNAQDKRMIREWLCGKKQILYMSASKPWRGQIYREWLASDIKWWAWVDTDTVIGDFRALWPWNGVDSFDVVTISEWDYGNIYLRGQFTAFQLNDKLDSIWLEYEPLKKPENLHKLPHGAVDEYAYSVLYSNKFTEVNWILVPRALGADKFGRNKLVNHGKKAYYVPAGMTRLDMALLFDSSYAPASKPIFAAAEPFNPKLWAVPLRELRQGDYVNGKPLNSWCDQKDTRCTVAREYYSYQSCVMRYDGQLLEYFDRRASPRQVKQDGYFGIEEKLLLHWQEIKRPDWFKMPESGVALKDVMEMSWDHVTTWDLRSRETTFQSRIEGHDIREAVEPYGFDYNSFNESGALPLPRGVMRDLASIALPELH